MQGGLAGYDSCISNPATISHPKDTTLIQALMATGTGLLTPTISQTMTGTITAATMAATDGAPGEWAVAGKIIERTPEGG